MNLFHVCYHCQVTWWLMDLQATSTASFIVAALSAITDSHNIPQHLKSYKPLVTADNRVSHTISIKAHPHTPTGQLSLERCQHAQPAPMTPINMQHHYNHHPRFESSVLVHPRRNVCRTGPPCACPPLIRSDAALLRAKRIISIQIPKDNAPSQLSSPEHTPRMPTESRNSRGVKQTVQKASTMQRPAGSAVPILLLPCRVCASPCLFTEAPCVPLPQTRLGRHMGDTPNGPSTTSAPPLASQTKLGSPL